MTELEPRRIDFDDASDDDKDDKEAIIRIYEVLKPLPLTVLENINEVEKIEEKCYDILNTDEIAKISIHKDVQEKLEQFANEINSIRKDLGKPGYTEMFKNKMNELDKYKLEVKGKIKELNDMKESLQYKQIFQYVKEEDDSNKFVLIIPGEEFITEDEILCFSKNSIDNIVRNYREWLLECIGKELLNSEGEPTGDVGMQVNENPNFYVGLPIDSDGTLGFVELGEVKTLSYLLENGLKFCYLVPTDEMISHTLSLKNTYGNFPDYVSANHCQRGSNIILFTLQICDGQQCNNKNIIEMMNNYVNEWTEPPLDENYLYKEELDDIELELELEQRRNFEEQMIEQQEQDDEDYDIIDNEEQLIPRRLFDSDSDDMDNEEQLIPRRLFDSDSDDMDNEDLRVLNMVEEQLDELSDEEPLSIARPLIPRRLFDSDDDLGDNDSNDSNDDLGDNDSGDDLGDNDSNSNDSDSNDSDDDLRDNLTEEEIRQYIQDTENDENDEYLDGMEITENI